MPWIGKSRLEEYKEYHRKLIETENSLEYAHRDEEVINRFSELITNLNRNFVQLAFANLNRSEFSENRSEMHFNMQKYNVDYRGTHCLQTYGYKNRVFTFMIYMCNINFKRFEIKDKAEFTFEPLITYGTSNLIYDRKKTYLFRESSRVLSDMATNLADDAYLEKYTSPFVDEWNDNSFSDHIDAIGSNEPPPFYE